MRRLTVVMLTLLVVAGCHRRHHDNAWDTKSDDSGGGPPIVTPDTTRPTVSSTVPANAATGVVIGSTMTATFSEAMLASTINSPATSFTVTDPLLVSVAGVVTYDPVTFAATFNPTADLAISTVYTATITVAVTDVAGNAMLVPYVWSFTTSADGIRPTVTWTYPANITSIWPLTYGPATGVPTNRRIAASFSEAMLASTIDLTSFKLTSAPGAVPVTGAVSYDAANQVAYFLPTGGTFASGTAFTATITTAVTDLAGNAMLADYVWSFTTGATADAIAPTVHCTIPDGGDVSAVPPKLWPTNRKIEAYFSEPMFSPTISVTSFTVMNDTLATPVTGTVSYDATNYVASFRPLLPFAISSDFTATITTAVTDLAGNTMALPYTWSFRTSALTDVTAPTVIATIPITGATLVPINTRVTAAFSEPMDSSTFTTTTFTFTLQDPTLTPVLGRVICPCPGTSGSFIPAADLLPSTLYTATVTTGVKDLAGNALLANYTWTFTTGAAARTGQASVDLAFADPFAILAGSTVTNTGPTVIYGDVGLDPGSAVVGLAVFPLATPGTVHGAIHVSDPTSSAAKGSLTAAYLVAEGRTVDPISCPGELGGLTLAPGLYKTAITTGITGFGILTLDAQGDENAVWVFQIGSDLTTTTSTQVVLSGGAQAKNIYWQVGASGTLGTYSIFKGNIMSLASVSLLTGATLDGRALAQVSAVTLDTNAVTKP